MIKFGYVMCVVIATVPNATFGSLIAYEDWRVESVLAFLDGR